VVVRAQPFVDTAEVETLSNLLTANPLAAGAGVSVLGLAGVVGSIFGNGKVSTVSAQQAYDLLLNEERVALLDIRSKVAAKAGTPDLREAKKKVLSLPYTQVRPSGSCPEHAYYHLVLTYSAPAAKLGVLSCAVLLCQSPTPPALWTQPLMAHRSSQ
jgi:hypothetical protein